MNQYWDPTDILTGNSELFVRDRNRKPAPAPTTCRACGATKADGVKIYGNKGGMCETCIMQQAVTVRALIDAGRRGDRLGFREDAK